MVALLCLLAPAQMASAHAILLTSEPAPSAVLDRSPNEIALFFDELVDTVFGDIRILDSTGAVIQTLSPSRDALDHSIVRAPIESLAEGTYVVIWRLASVDSHPVQGFFSFQIGNKSIEVSALNNYQVPERHGLANLFNVIRFVTYLGIILLIGGVGLLQRVRVDRISSRSMLGLKGGLAFAVMGTLEGLIAYGPHASGLKIYEALDLTLLSQTMTTQYGKMQVLRIVFLVVVGVLIAVIRFRGTLWWKLSAWIALVGVAITLSLAGHPVATSPLALSIALDILHMVAVSLWVGPLLIIVYDRTMWLGNDESTSGTSLRWFSRISGFLVPIIVITGVGQAWLMMNGMGNVFASRYGRLLIVKVSIVIVLIGLGGLSRVAMRQKRSVSLRQSMGVEVLLGVIVLTVTAALVAIPPQGVIQPAALSSTVFQNNMIVELSLTSPKVGQSEVHVGIDMANGSLTRFDNTTARLSMPTRKIPYGPIVLEKTGPNHFIGITEFAYPGEWVIEILVKQSTDSTTIFRVAVEIKK